ncbi:hypothetical protein POL72_27695 [Sorangium sp. wiwo2]|uniref:Uncharacterized protein n=1 Tax=Sorangium atrum TaxID=2995308 RepID=A0ABT5C700_9BACT|nr:hypothetical protein [Sorangium aterium]MDC0681554.1 hypothetical protein [Sorangium aterium]
MSDHVAARAAVDESAHGAVGGDHAEVERRGDQPSAEHALLSTAALAGFGKAQNLSGHCAPLPGAGCCSPVRVAVQAGRGIRRVVRPRPRRGRDVLRRDVQHGLPAVSQLTDWTSETGVPPTKSRMMGRCSIMPSHPLIHVRQFVFHFSSQGSFGHIDELERALGVFR